MICTEKDGREILYEQQRLGNKYYMNRKGWEMFYMNSKGLEKSVIWTEKVGDVLYEQQRFGGNYYYEQQKLQNK